MIEKLKSFASSDRIRYWIKEASRFFSLQILITGINMVIGFLVIRILSKEEYAYYTVSFSILSMFTVITNTGISPTLNSQSGLYWQDKEKMGILITTARMFRKRIAYLFAIPILVYCFFQLTSIGLGVLDILAIVLVLIITIKYQFDLPILQTPLLFNGEVKFIQNAELKTSILRLVLILALSYIWPSAISVLITSTLTAYILWKLYNTENTKFLSKESTESIEIKNLIWGLFKPNIVNTILFSFQMQVTILLCSIFGTIANVAELGAMSRIMQLFLIFNVFVSNFIVPKLAKEEKPLQVLKITTSVIAVYSLLIVFLVFIAWIYPSGFILLLGSKYENIKPILLLFVPVSGMWVLHNCMSLICSAKGWMKYMQLYTPISIAVQVLLFVFFRPNSLASILIYDGIVATTGFIYYVVNYLITYYQYKKDFQYG